MKKILVAITVIAMIVMAMLRYIERGETKKSSCGTLNGRVIEVDHDYLFFPLSYLEVDEWTPGYSKRMATMGCKDELHSFSLAVEWPSLEPSGRMNTRFTAPRPSNVAFTYRKIFTKTPAESQLNILNGYFREQFVDRSPILSVPEMQARSQYQEDLGLWSYSMPSRSVYVEEKALFDVDPITQEVLSIIRCDTILRSGVTECRSTQFDTKNRVHLKLIFDAVLLSQRHELKARAIALLEQLTKKKE